ncbi:facilitated trehalose transporter Tret1-like [Diabrotica undecimpunctata]|uniref:facilitated trehalose transporter Tret1-like n=1 Tax=Diabrotica undecimpunctata TaxID=50387 RepID=UPI003B63CBF4
MSRKSVYNEDNKPEVEEVAYLADETECEHEHEAKKTSTLFLYCTIILLQIPVFTAGSHVVWNSPVVPMLMSNDSQINPLGRPATTADISMIAGMPALSGLFGSLILPKFSDFLGRKLFLQITVSMTLVGLMMLTFSTSVTMMVISKFIAGMFTSGAPSIIPIYVTELCEDHNRAKFGCLIGLFLQLGHFYTFIVGPLFSYRLLNFVISFPLILFLLLFVFFPESPVYLFSKGRRTQCEIALRKLRSHKNNNEIKKDMEKLEDVLKSKQYIKRNFNIVTLFKTKESRLGLFLALLPVAVQHLSGVSVILSFMAPFFDSAGTSFSGNKVAMIVSAVKITCISFTSTVVERVGRKRMLLISALGSGIPLFGLGWFFYLKHINSPIIYQLQWLPLLLVLLNVGFYSLGLGPIPTAIMHEMFTPEKRAAAGSFINTFTCILISSLTSTYPIIAATIGTHWAVWLYSFCCLVGAALIYKFLPQTTGKSLSEIQELLKQY